MPCCEAEKYDNWCAAEPTFDCEGKEYCIFHAPAECPEKQDVEAFNKKVFERIDKCKKDGKDCDLSGAIFPGDISFDAYDQYNPLPNVDFTRAKFCGYANFANAEFSSVSIFSYAKFCNHLECSNAVFSGNSYFDNATFQGNVHFSDTTFINGISFAYAHVFCEFTFDR